MEGIFIFFFLLSLLSEGKMDWGLLLHCAALTFTLARALRSGKCHRGRRVSAWAGSCRAGLRGCRTGMGGTGVGGAGTDLSPAGGNFVPEEGGGAVPARGSPAPAWPCDFIFRSFGSLEKAGCSFSLDQDSQLC